LLLENWFIITDSAQAAAAASALLAWGEIFPGSIRGGFMGEAENLVSSSRSNVDIMEGALQLFETLVSWSKKQEDGVENRLKWMIKQLTDFQTHHLIVTGMSGTGKSTFVNFALGEEMFNGTPTTTFVSFKNDEHEEISEITNEGIRAVTSLSDFHGIADGQQETAASIVDVKLPASFLEEHGLSLIDTPGFNGFGLHDYEVIDYLRMADSLLFVLNADEPLTEKEREILAHLKETVPEMPIHFLLNKMDTVYNETEMIRMVDETWERVNSYFPHAKIFAFSSQFDSRQQLSDLSSFIHSIIPRGIMEEDRTGKLLFFIRKAITELLHRRVELENTLVESNQWNEGAIVKLNGALNQLNDIEAEKTRIIKRSYQKIKEDIQDEMRVEIPRILKGSADFITEESDFGKIHVSLNNEMNNRVQNYLQQMILPKYLSELQNWIELSSEEFHQSQLYFNEMAQGFNDMYGTEQFQLKCDFRVLDDWGRDAFRMTNGVQMENMNIAMRSTPSQFLLKSAGKLFGALSQNNALLYNKYKSFVENDDYHDVTNSIVNGFMQKFELFEKSLERDIALFFHHPVAELKQAVNVAEQEMVLNDETLKKMRTNPELYRDPLRLFEMKQRQFEWLTLAKRAI
ncbi:MAG: dynamin family protein, partial [Bacillota bacterium]|nr:dynamin family protein [Bacillota bacterium]